MNVSFSRRREERNCSINKFTQVWYSTMRIIYFLSRRNHSLIIHSVFMCTYRDFNHRLQHLIIYFGILSLSFAKTAFVFIAVFFLMFSCYSNFFISKSYNFLGTARAHVSQLLRPFTGIRRA